MFLTVYRFLLVLVGLCFLLSGLAIAGLAALDIARAGPDLTEGAFDTGQGVLLGIGALTAALGLPILSSKRRPDWLHAPSRAAHPIAAALYLSILGALAAFASAGAGALPLFEDGTPAFLFAPVILAAVVAGLAVAVILPLAALAVLTSGQAHGPDTPAEDGLSRVLILLSAALTMALAALAAVFLAYALGYLPQTPVIPILGAAAQEPRLALAALVIAALSIVPIGLLRGRGPRGLGDVAMKALQLALLAGPGLYFAEEVIAALLPQPWGQVHALRFQIVGGLSGAILILSVLIAMRAPDPMPIAPQAPAQDRRGSKLTNAQVKRLQTSVDVPNAGFLMKAYLVTDWLLLRLCGAALLGMAYMIHLAGDDLVTVGGMLYGIAPRTVMIVYAVWGVLLLLPVFLPRFVSRPETVLGGAAKSAILVGLALLIMPGLDGAIDMFVPDDYREVLHASVPRMFKAIAGIAVFSAMAIALFRQLGHSRTQVDGFGRRVQRFSEADLRELRAARMQG